MYQSRIRISNGIVTLAVDTGTGELIELVNERNGDNLIKNHYPEKHQPMSLFVRNRDNVYAVFPADNARINRDPSLSPEISVRNDNGSKTIRVTYKKLASDTAAVNIGAAYEAELPDGSHEIKWRLSIDNRSGDIVEKVLFPAIYGVYLGETWRDDSLAYPYNSGELIRNPVETYEKEPSVIGWKWQNYYYSYIMDGVGCAKGPDGSYVREVSHSGPLSMMWLDYFENGSGLYLACDDKSSKVASLRAETFGRTRPGMGFSIVHYPFAGEGLWNSPECIAAVHDGDWHWAADCYRRALARQEDKTLLSVPSWFTQSPGLAAHYDFKYQCGGIVHKFADIPKLFDKAQQLGLDHLLLAGWHIDGFDNGFPQYKPDPDLGTSEELAAAVHEVRRKGGHVSFYINSRLSNDRYDHLENQREQWGAKDADGNIYREKYGDSGISFSVMCPNEVGWRKTITDAVEWLVKKAGADGVYLDQMCAAPPIFCFNREHAHEPNEWNNGYRQMLKDIHSKLSVENPAIMYEGTSDIHGDEVSGQLISTFFHHHSGAFPELYKYTFPEQILIDMLYPMRGQAMRPVHVAQKGREIMDRAFIIGSYYWCYDLEEDNTYDNDPSMKSYLAKMIRLRRIWTDSFGHGIFRDTQGLVNVTEGLHVKLFSLGERGILLAAANPGGIKGGCIEISSDSGVAENDEAEIYSIDAPDSPRRRRTRAGENGVLVDAPEEALSIIHIRRPSEEDGASRPAPCAASL